jgi:CheY-like chemotaxis protein
MKRRVMKAQMPGKPGPPIHGLSGVELQGSMPWRLLVVEGDAHERELLTAYLGMAGYVVQGAETGTLALKLAVAQPPDLVLLNLHLADMDGFEVCRLLCQEPTTQDVPVVIFTESEELTLHRHAYAAGVQACVPKPVRRPALVATIEAVLAGARRKKATAAARDEKAKQAPTTPGVRQFERFPVSLPAVGWTAQFPGKVIEGMVRDISAGGFMAEFSIQMVPGNTVNLVLDTHRGALELKGRVVWNSVSGKVARHGFAFSQPKAPDFAASLLAAESH